MKSIITFLAALAVSAAVAIADEKNPGPKSTPKPSPRKEPLKDKGLADQGRLDNFEIQQEIQKRKKPAAPTKPVKGKVKVSDIPIIKTSDTATPK